MGGWAWPEIGEQSVPVTLISNYTSRVSDFGGTQLWIRCSLGDKSLGDELRGDDRGRRGMIGGRWCAWAKQGGSTGCLGRFGRSFLVFSGRGV